MPLVSVVVPAHNPGHFLERSVGSVLRQCFDDLECIVVDDGSSEDISTNPVFEERRVRLHRQDNSGVSVARNVGVALSDSEHVAFLDQDDEWLPGKLGLQVQSLGEAPAASFSHTPFTWVLASGERPSRPQTVTYTRSLAGEVHVCMSSILVSRWHHDAIGGFDPFLAQQQDWDYILKLMRVFGEPVSSDVPDVRYFVHGNNASSDYAAAEREAQNVLGRNAAWAVLRGDAEALAAIRQGRRVSRKLHAHQAVDRARESARDRDLTGALSHLGRGAALDPALVGRALFAGLGRRA